MKVKVNKDGSPLASAGDDVRGNSMSKFPL